MRVCAPHELSQGLVSHRFDFGVPYWPLVFFVNMLATLAHLLCPVSENGLLELDLIATYKTSQNKTNILSPNTYLHPEQLQVQQQKTKTTHAHYLLLFRFKTSLQVG